MDIGPRRERASARAGEDHRADAGFDLDDVQRRHQPVDQIVIEGVEPARPVQRDQGNSVIDLQQHGIGHGRVSQG